jgi:hypothetical protein
MLAVAANGNAFTWPPYDAAKRQDLVIDLDFAVESSADLCTFWDKVCRLPLGVALICPLCVQVGYAH